MKEKDKEKGKSKGDKEAAQKIDGTASSPSLPPFLLLRLPPFVGDELIPVSKGEFWIVDKDKDAKDSKKVPP